MVRTDMLATSLAAVSLLPALALGQSCPLKPSGKIQPSVASGYQMQVVATGIPKPRGILVDSANNLLVVEQGTGKVTAHKLQESNGCVTAAAPKDVTDKLDLNHGIELSSDGKTLYASSSETAYSWPYNADTMSVGQATVLVTNMTTSDHTARTLLLPRKAPGMLVITKGSTSNIDFDATDITSGHSQVKAFNLTAMNGTAYNYNTDGILLGWGLRNEVGIGEHPTSGAIYGVENSADNVNRTGMDVHQDNPAEELNFLGYLNGTKYDQQGQNFGYPWCFTAWKPSDLPDNSNLTVGSQFAVDSSPDLQGQNKTDEWCAGQVPPRLSFQAHMAPLDIKFNDSGREAWIPFHGSWDRSNPAGYRLTVVEFNDNGDPVEPANSTTAAKDVLANMDNSKCPSDCFRPVATAMDGQGRIFMTSDASGEVYMITKASSASAMGKGQSTSGAHHALPPSPLRAGPAAAWAAVIGAATVIGLLM